MAARLLTPDAILANKWQYFDGLSRCITACLAELCAKIGGNLQHLTQLLPRPQMRLERSKDQLQALNRALDAALRSRQHYILASLSTNNKNCKFGRWLGKCLEKYRLKLRPVVQDVKGSEILSAAQFTPGQNFALIFKDGTVDATSHKISLS